MKVNLQVDADPGTVLDHTRVLTAAGADGLFTFEGPHDVFLPAMPATTSARSCSPAPVTAFVSGYRGSQRRNIAASPYRCRDPVRTSAMSIHIRSTESSWDTSPVASRVPRVSVMPAGSHVPPVFSVGGHGRSSCRTRAASRVRWSRSGTLVATHEAST